jgi:hypothetical protein
MQVTIARQLGLEPTTVGNFFMNARRRSHDKWREGPDGSGSFDGDDLDEDDSDSNIKYEVYDCGDGMDGGGDYQDHYDPHMTSLGDETTAVTTGYHTHGMTAIPAPVHNPHNQLQSYPSSCA